MNILITGATGLVGRELGKELVRRGHRIFIISRNREQALLNLPFPAHVIEGNLGRETLRDDRLREIEAVIHLAGENIAGGRWTSERKKRIYDSRVLSLQNLIASLQDKARLKVFISTSAVGLYGDRGDEIISEATNANNNFLSQVCQDWEQPLLVADKKKIWPQMRAVILRLGVVLSPMGGALEKMLEPFQLGLGGRLGSGKQWMSWIHLEDVVRLFVHALEENEMSQIYNAVAPEPVTNQDFSQLLAAKVSITGRMGPPVPKIALQAGLGEMAQILLDSQRVTSLRIKDTRFKYKFPRLEEALTDVLSLCQKGDSVFIAEQYFPYPVEDIFPFFSNATNLEKITPPLLNFKIQSISSEKVQKGTLIDYRLKVHGVPIGWTTEIEEWRPNEVFVDNQLKGPYKKWNHTHQFEQLGSGTLMTDVVRYRLPMGVFGKLAGGAFVRGDIEKIFAYRRSRVSELIGR